jgi:dTDP-4-dehydrorhamnose reductase
MQVLVLGGSGQIGRALLGADWPEDVSLVAPTRAELDLTDEAQIMAAVGSRRWSAVINAAAYTAVDRAETDTAAAWRANALGPALLAQTTRATGIPLIHISTDYVFDGEKQGFYEETDATRPLGVYGASKLAGEDAVRTGTPRHVIVRTAWVVSAHGSNFVKSVLRLAGERPSLNMVDDQRGCPTSAADLAGVLVAITTRVAADPNAPLGTFHFVNAGEATWCSLARRILAASAARGGPTAEVAAIATNAYPTPARRPRNSRLATAKIEAAYGIVARPWETTVDDLVSALLPD